MSSDHSHPVLSGKATARLAGTIDQDLAALTARVAALENAAKPPPSVYTFQDEFDGTALKPWWKPLYNSPDAGDRNNTDCLGNLSQVTVANGQATINCDRKPTPSGRPFASAAMCTDGAFSQKYGTWEVRAGWDEVPGSWPSIFLFEPGKQGCCPEVDWTEAYGSVPRLGPGKVEHVVYAAAGGPSRYVIMPIAPGLHDYKMVWTATSLLFSIDGVPSSTNYLDGATGQPTGLPLPASYIPQVPLYLSFIYGIDSLGAQVTPNHSSMVVEYVHVTA